MREDRLCLAGALLKEAVEDLEWSSGSQSIALYIRRSPPQITMCAQGLGELLIALPVTSLPPTNLSQQPSALPLEGLTLLAYWKVPAGVPQIPGMMGTFVMLCSRDCGGHLQHRLHGVMSVELGDSPTHHIMLYSLLTL